MLYRSRVVISGVFGLLMVILGALGTHALAYANQELWHTAGMYHLGHTAVLLWLSREKERFSWAFLAFSIGILFFCGGLYVLAATGAPWVKVFIPIGGSSLILGWAFLIGAALKKD